jgi:hypothetical protein
MIDAVGIPGSLRHCRPIRIMPNAGKATINQSDAWNDLASSQPSCRQAGYKSKVLLHGCSGK